MSLLRTLLYTLVFYPGSVPYVVGALISARLGRKQALYSFSRNWSRYQHWCARWLLGIRLRIEGELPQTGAIVAIKHESFYEAFETLRVFRLPAVVFKAELLSIPLWGRVALAHGVIPVEREAGASALRTMLRAARAAVAEGRPIVIFPEGTRVPHGEAAPLRPGVAGLYKALGLPVVPVACNSGVVWGWRRFVKTPGVITFRVGAPIPSGLSREEIEARVHEGINALNR